MTMKYDEQDLCAIRATGLLKNDAANDESIFFAQELQVVKAKTYDVKVPENNAMKIFPVAMDTDPGADTIAFDSYDSVGMAKIIASYADDLPRADIKATRTVARVFGIGTSYGYNTKDIRHARMTGKPLVTRKAEAARRANDQRINQIAFKGDKEHQIVGIVDHPNISAYVPAAGASGKITWADKTADEILADMNGIVTLIVESTYGVEIPDTLLLPIEKYQKISTMKVPDTNGKTVLNYFLETNPHIKEVKQVHEMKGIGTDGADVMMAYRNDPNALELTLPLAFTQYAPQQKNLEFVVPCESSIAGILVYYPMSIAKCEGI
ncbi:MAG: DUF2184 domain-containing protein [Phascolarctobacterium sp.]|nr:DUF2184 domain-containing protein [Phascolarctobacterium sp.]MBR6636849.1 DUF2184 domain-containing protein [Phascolarctobacterium sp.]